MKNNFINCYAVIVGKLKQKPSKKAYMALSIVLKSEEHLVGGRITLKNNYYYFDDLKSANTFCSFIIELGLGQAKVKKDKVDYRYMQKIHLFVVDLPPVEMENYIFDILNQVCREDGDLICNEDYLLNTISYSVNACGIKKFNVVYSKNGSLITGVQHGKMYATKEPNKHWKQLLNSFEKDVVRWKKDHIGLYEAQA